MSYIINLFLVFNLATDSASAVYPEGTLLLETRMRHGKISYKEKDILARYRKWKPPKRLVKDLKSEWKKICDAKVMFIAEDADRVSCRVVEVKKRFWERIACDIQRRMCQFLCCLCVCMIFECFRCCALKMYNCIKSCTLAVYNRIKNCVLGDVSDPLEENQPRVAVKIT